MKDNEKVRLGMGNIFVIALVFVGCSLISLGVSYGFSDLKHDSSTVVADSCDKSFSDLYEFTVNDKCDEYSFYISDAKNNINFSGVLKEYELSNRYTLKLDFDGTPVAPDFFVNKEKLAINGSSLRFYHEDKYVIVKTSSDAIINGEYIAVIDSTNGNIIFVFEDGEVEFVENTLTIVKHYNNVFCDDTSDSLVTGKRYTYKINSEGIVLENEANNTCDIGE